MPEILHCSICETPETDRPLILGRFEGEAAYFCPPCMPQLIHAMPKEEVARRVRESQRAQKG